MGRLQSDGARSSNAGLGDAFHVEPHPLRFLRNLGRSRRDCRGLRQARLRRRRGQQLRMRALPALGPPSHPAAADAFRTITNRGPVASAERSKTWAPLSSSSARCSSTRPDLIPLDVIEELQLLQEHVRPFPYGASSSRHRTRSWDGPPASCLPTSIPQPIAAGIALASPQGGRPRRPRAGGQNTPAERRLARSNAICRLMTELALLVQNGTFPRRTSSIPWDWSIISPARSVAR